MKHLTRFVLTVLVALASSISASAENYILYTSLDGTVVMPYSSSAFGANIVSNTYEEGQGKILFDGEVTSIGDFAFHNCSGLKSITIPNSVISIGYHAFYSCNGLTSVNIPNNVTEIGSFAFRGCSGLTSINIPNSVTEIGRLAFYACSGLKSINIPNNVTKIHDNTFYYCSSLTSITIPNSVTEIGSSAFNGCSSLKEITSLAIVPPTIYSKTFDKVPKDKAVLKVPAEAVDAYKAADYWNEFLNIEGIEVTTGINSVGSAANLGKTYGINGVVVGDGCKGIVIRDGKKFVVK